MWDPKAWEAGKTNASDKRNAVMDRFGI
jgi:hypothetical protein